MKKIVVAMFILALTQQVFAQADEIDKYVTGEMQKSHVPGMSIAVVQHGKLLYTQHYGIANVELAVAVTTNSVFKIASLTNPITAIAVLTLVQDGRLLLDSTIGHYVPGLPAQWNTLTIRQLLSHTSGIADYFESPDWSWRNSWRMDLTHEEFINMAGKTPAHFKPGTSISYSNTGFYLLGMLIEK
jgi:D-alanyl-D-alanine carboxypeptidase